jgi:hypothetical protein
MRGRFPPPGGGVTGTAPTAEALARESESLRDVTAEAGFEPTTVG